MFQPEWVIEQSLNFTPFKHCGDEDLFPFKCWACGRPLVLCYECDVLFVDLHNLASRSNYVEQCPHCDTAFDDRIMRSPRHRISYHEWRQASLEKLLVERSLDEYVRFLCGTADQLRDMLKKGLRSIVRTRLTEFRNLAESLMIGIPHSTRWREEGAASSHTASLSEAIVTNSTIGDPIGIAYFLLGLTDAVFG